MSVCLSMHIAMVGYWMYDVMLFKSCQDYRLRIVTSNGIRMRDGSKHYKLFFFHRICIIKNPL